MKRFHFRFPRRVRIHGGDCDAVARALHHEAQKGALEQNEQTLISDEKAFWCRADQGMVLRSTSYERKQMSTKTSLKRIALIAVSALTLGFVGVAPSSAGTDITFTSGAGVAGSGTSTDPFIIQAGVAYATVFTATSTPALTGVTVTPALPTGVSYNATTNVLSATTGTSVTAKAAYTVTSTAPSAKTGTFYLTIQAGAVTVTSNQPWRASSPAGTFDDTTGAVAIAKTATAVTDTVTIAAAADTAAKSGTGNYRYLEVTGSTFAATNIAGAVPNGTLASGTTAGTATQLAMPQSGSINGGTVSVHTAATGTVTVKFYDRSTDAVTGYSVITPLQTITITVSAPGALNAAKSEAVICATATTGTYPVASGCDYTVLTGDDDVLAKAALASAGGVTSGIGTAKAVIRVSLKDVTGSGLIGTLPAVGASIDGPGTLSIGTAANADASTGRYLTAAAAPANVFYINVFSDGNNGVGTVSILVGGSVWKTKTVSFYGAPTKLTASAGLKVLKAGTAYAVPSTACVLVATCGTTVALTPVVQVLATDNKGIAVPGLTYTATPDATVLLSGSSSNNYGDAIADSIGATWFGVTTSPSAASGATGTVSYKTLLADGTTYLTSNTLSFAIGGAPVAVTMGLAAGASTEVGAKSSLVFADKDAAGNAAYDADVALALTSNVALVVGTAAATAGNALPATIAMIGGTGTVKFYNPLVPGNVTISGLAAGLIAVSTTFTVQNSAVNAAADAALEAIDAATAATDAANLAAEAADAATMAAQDAKDAADAATAAVEALAQQVATMIDALKAQLKTLATIVAKIAKKVKA